MTDGEGNTAGSPWLDVRRGTGNRAARSDVDRRGGSGPVRSRESVRSSGSESAVCPDGGPLRIAVNGATGRMGRTVIETAAGREDVTVTFQDFGTVNTGLALSPGDTASVTLAGGADVDLTAFAAVDVAPRAHRIERHASPLRV